MTEKVIFLGWCRIIDRKSYFYSTGRIIGRKGYSLFGMEEIIAIKVPVKFVENKIFDRKGYSLNGKDNWQKR